MTAQLLTSELSTLIQETKRKNPELRSVRCEILNCRKRRKTDGNVQAAEKSLTDLRSLPRTSEAQIAAGLSFQNSSIMHF